MAKYRTNDTKDLFKPEVPKMPEGYYSGDKPNPNLKRFVCTWRKPDIPADGLPNSEVSAIEIDRANELYNIHKYWSKKGYEGIAHYLQAFTCPGDVVLDPFCGSGGTGLVALKHGRIPVLIDSSPAATFISKGYVTPADPHVILKALDYVKKSISDVLNSAYGTICSHCQRPGEISYVIFSKRFQCDKCLSFTPYSLWLHGPTRRFRGRISPTLLCPHCNDPLHTNTARQGGFAPIKVSYICSSGCKPKRKYRGIVNGELIEEERFLFDSGEHIDDHLLCIAKNAPDVPLSEILEPRLYRNLAKAGAIKVSDLHFSRALAVLVTIREAIIKSPFDEDTRSLLSLCLSSVLWITSKQCRAESTQVLDATYYIPHEIKELNVWQSFSKKVQRLAKAKEQQEFKETRCVISTQSATDLSAIPSESLDYIFTDPPYGAKYQYGQLNLLWEAWLRMDRSWYSNELVVANHRDMGWADWRKVFFEAAKEMFRVLKSGRWLTLCYHDTAEGTWELVQDVMAEVGFIIVNEAGVLAIDAKQKTYNQLTSETVNKRDLIINYRKPIIDEVVSTVSITGNEDKITFSDKVRLIVREFLSENPGSTKDRIFDGVVSRMVRSGQMEAHDFDALLRTIAEEVKTPVKKDLFRNEEPNIFGTHEIGRWYLKETELVTADAAENAREDAAAEKIGVFIKGFLTKNPGDEGVHYSDLFEHYIYAVKDKPRRQLAEFLPDYFYKTEQGTWRLPASEEEEKAKSEARVKGLGRRVKRYIAQLEQGAVIPDHERPNDATLAEWIRHCKRAGLYEQGKFLYEKGGLNPDNLLEEAMVNVEEDYQVCARMLVRDAGEPKRRRKKTGAA